MLFLCIFVMSGFLTPVSVKWNGNSLVIKVHKTSNQKKNKKKHLLYFFDSKTQLDKKNKIILFSVRQSAVKVFSFPFFFFFLNPTFCWFSKCWFLAWKLIFGQYDPNTNVISKIVQPSKAHLCVQKINHLTTFWSNSKI